jgi:hypothetical protein
MFDWQRLAPKRCYLCGGEGADTSDHVVPRVMYAGSLSSDVIVLPAYFECNNGMSKHEERVVFSWATCRPGYPKEDALYAKAMRGLFRPEAAGLLASFPDNLQPLESGGALVHIPGLRVHYVLAKMVKGLLYRENGHVLAPRTTWLMAAAHLNWMVEFETGTLIHTPRDVVTAKYQQASTFEHGVCFLGMGDGRVYAVLFFGEDADVPPSRLGWVTLPWPRPPSA